MWFGTAPGSGLSRRGLGFGPSVGQPRKEGQPPLPGSGILVSFDWAGLPARISPVEGCQPVGGASRCKNWHGPLEMRLYLCPVGSRFEFLQSADGFLPGLRPGERLKGNRVQLPNRRATVSFPAPMGRRRRPHSKPIGPLKTGREGRGRPETSQETCRPPSDAALALWGWHRRCRAAAPGARPGGRAAGGWLLKKGA